MLASVTLCSKRWRVPTQSLQFTSIRAQTLGSFLPKTQDTLPWEEQGEDLGHPTSGLTTGCTLVVGFVIIFLEVAAGITLNGTK